MAGIYSQGGSAGHRYAGWLSKVEAKNFHFGGKVFNGSPSAIYVGSNLVWMNGWLKAATKQAIMAAFGVDGTAVIRATNEYLNGIAASDKAKATALAGFINSMPLSVGYILNYPSEDYRLLGEAIQNDAVKEMVGGSKQAFALFGGTLTTGKSWSFDTKVMLQPNALTQWEMYIRWSNRTGNAQYGNYYAGGGYNGIGFSVMSDAFQVRKGIIQVKTTIQQDYVFMKRTGSKVYYSLDRDNWTELISIESISPTGMSVSGTNGSWGQSSLYTQFPVDLTLIIVTTMDPTHPLTVLPTAPSRRHYNNNPSVTITTQPTTL
jgi:hypothetical protein